MFPYVPTKVKSTLGFRFRALPSDVMASRTLSSTAKLLFAAIVDAARGTRSGLCKAANATLGDRIGRSESEVGRCLLELEAAGLVRREYGPSKNVRVGVAVTWTEAVPQGCGTERPCVPQQRGAGSPDARDRVPQGPGPGRAPSEPKGQSVPILSTTEEGKNPDPKPSPAEIAAVMRSWLGGRHGAKLFDGGTSDARPLFSRVGYSARAAVAQSRSPRKDAATQLAELAEWHRRREGGSFSGRAGGG